MSIRWRRFAVIGGLGVVGAAFLGGGIASGQLPMNIALSGQNFTGTTTAITAEGITAYPRSVDTTAGAQPSIAVSIDSARLSDVCLSTVARGLPLIGNVTLFARIPGDGATAENLVVDVASVTGSIDVSDVRLGLDAAALGEENGARTSAVSVGNSWAPSTRIDIIALAASAASITGLTVSAESGEHYC